MNIEDKIQRKIGPLLTSKCDISSVLDGKSEVIYTDIACRLDGSGTPTLNPDGMAKQNFTTHYLWIPKNGIEPSLVNRVKITSGSVEDMLRDLIVKDLDSNSDSAFFCFICESGILRNRN